MVASLGDQPQDVLRGAADEVLAWLKVRMRMNTPTRVASRVRKGSLYKWKLTGLPLVDYVYS